MLNAIDGIVVDVEELERRWTLGQHKGRDDHDGAVAGLRVSNDADSLAFAGLMDEA
jgi:predicted FMN-binding regulatory protein PaiB